MFHTLLLGDYFQVTYPLDVLRLRMAVDPGHQTMSNVRLIFTVDLIQEVFLN